MAVVPPTLVSTFEVLFSPQLPPSVPIPFNVASSGETVIKGYFLTISNPNTVTYRFDVGFHTNVDPEPQPAFRKTLASAMAFLDDGSPGEREIISGSAPDLLIDVTVPARGTVLLSLLPAYFNLTGFDVDNIDIRGFVDITLPALLARPGFGFVPQAAAPVPILVTAEQRLTFLPTGNSPDFAVESQSAFALPLAQGAASFSVPPQPAHFIILGALAAKKDRASSRLHRLLSSSPSAATETLAMLIASTPTVSDGKKSVVDIMKELGISEGEHEV